MKGALKNGKPTSEAREGENCFLLSGFPRTPEYAGDVSCIIAITYDEKRLKAENSKIEDVAKIFPACWNGQYVPHFVRAEAEFLEIYGWTHLVLLEGPDYGVYFQGNLYFADMKIARPFIVLAFNKNDKTYHHFHCVNCCEGVAEFFMNNQPIWKARYETIASLSIAPTSSTRH